MENILCKKLFLLFKSNFKHFFRRIKLPVLFLIFCASSTIASVANSQNTKVILSNKSLTIRQLVRQIENQTSYLFVFNSDKIDLNEEVRIEERESTVKNILTKAFAHKGISYRVEGENIILMQDKKIVTGKIVDSKGEPLIGVSIREKGTTNGTITDINGDFSLNVKNQSAVLVCSYVGYISKEFSVAGKSSFHVTLLESNTTLNEIVITGFGLSQKKASLTGAISSIGDKDISRSLATTVSGTLVGKIAGINSRQADGRPGASTSIQIRNMGTPLYVIDGIIKDEGQFNNLDQNDIESISILKDASAAIYGVRAANGVVVVTTKRGHLNSVPTVAVNAYYGWQHISRFAKPADVQTYLRSYIQSQTVQGVTNYTYSKEDYEKWCQGTEKGYRPFDWYKYIWITSPQTYINVSSSGGSDRTNYYFSVGHLDQQAMIRNYGGFFRTNVQMNIDSRINSKLKVGVSMNGRIEERKNPGVPGSDDYWLPMFATYRNLPTKRPYANDNPDYPTMTSSEADTNFAFLNYNLSGKYDEKWRVIQLNANMEYDIFKGLKAKWLVGYYLAYQQLNNHEFTYKLYGYDATTDTYPVIFENTNPWRERRTGHNEEVTSNFQLSYDRTFGKHHVAAIAGLEASKLDTPTSWLHSIPVANAMNLIDYTTMDEYDDTGNNTQARLGWLGRFNYDFANKYLIELSGREDGSWKFAPGHRWGFFPSASVGWRISEEKFWQNWKVSDYFNDLKIRASYGLVGDDTDETIGSYYSAFDYMEGYNYNNGGAVIDGAWTVGSVARNLPSTNLSWVKAKILDIGADMSFLNNKLSAQFDYFRRKRTGLPAKRYDVLIPNEVGFSLPYENLNSDLRKGFDMSIVYRDKWQDLNYSVGFNMTYARKYNWDQYKPRFSNSWDYYRNSAYQRYSDIYWGYEADGQFQSWDEIANYPIDNDGQGNKTLRPGDIKYKDLNGDGVINGMDQRPIGYATSGTPTINYGINVSLAYKGFDLSFDLTGGNLMSFMPQYESQYPFHDGGNNPQYMLSDTWHLKDIWDANSELIPGKYPMPLIGNSSHSNYWNSTFWLVNVHYIKLRNFEFGYTINQKFLSKLKISSVRLYVAGSNVFTWTNKPGCDPEGTTNSGLQYPTTRVINMGVNLKF